MFTIFQKTKNLQRSPSEQRTKSHCMPWYVWKNSAFHARTWNSTWNMQTCRMLGRSICSRTPNESITLPMDFDEFCVGRSVVKQKTGKSQGESTSACACICPRSGNRSAVFGTLKCWQVLKYFRMSHSKRESKAIYTMKKQLSLVQEVINYKHTRMLWLHWEGQATFACIVFPALCHAWALVSNGNTKDDSHGLQLTHRMWNSGRFHQSAKLLATKEWLLPEVVSREETSISITTWIKGWYRVDMFRN